MTDPSQLTVTGQGGTPEAALVRRFRLALLLLALATCTGSALELAALRHWNGTDQLVPWVVLGLLVTGVLALAVHRARGSILWARALGGIALLGGAFGIYEHFESNLEAGALSRQYETTWATLPALEHWWLALSGGVGPAPALAPGFLALTGALLALSTLGET